MTSGGFCKKKERRPERFFTVRFFNMVECALALAVVAIGVVSIVALFPVGMNATRDAIADSYAADAADLFLHYQAGRLKTSWSNTSGILIKSSTPPPTGSPVTIPGTSTTMVDGLNGAILIQQGTDFSGLFRIWRSNIVSTIPQNIAVGLNLEVSWPAQAPYLKRQRALYYLEVFNPNP